MTRPFSRSPRAGALCALLALLLCAGCAAGCAKAAPADNPPLADTAPAEQAPAPESETPAAPEGDPVPPEAVPLTAAPPDTPVFRDLPAFEGNPYVYVNNGEPAFTGEEHAFPVGTERYGELDELGRCTTTFVVVGPETMPTEERGSIGEVKPTGWQMAKYDFVDGKYLYNRCHLLGFQLTGENANVQNLITGTRYLNVEGMLPFENAVADYVQATGNHVLMRVSPVFDGDELLARGVHMMAESVEDAGDGVSFNVFVYNVQPGVVIDYRTGDNMLAEEATPLPDVSGTPAEEAAPAEQAQPQPEAPADKGTAEYVLNTNSKKFHKPSCSSVDQMKDKNRQDVTDTRENIIAQGYDPCKRCNP